MLLDSVETLATKILKDATDERNTVGIITFLTNRLFPLIILGVLFLLLLALLVVFALNNFKVIDPSFLSAWANYTGWAFAVMILTVSIVFIAASLYLWSILEKPQFNILRIGAEEKEREKRGSEYRIIRGIYTQAEKSPTPWILAIAVAAAWIASLLSLYYNMQASVTLMLTILFTLAVIAYQVYLRKVYAETDFAEIQVKLEMPGDLGALFTEIKSILPKKVRVGHSHSVLLGLRRALKEISHEESIKGDKEPDKGKSKKLSEANTYALYYGREGYGSEDKSKTLPEQNASDEEPNDVKRVQNYGKGETYLEVELQAVGVKIQGDNNKLRIPEDSETPGAVWNCSFPSAGIHTLDLTINRIYGDKAKDQLLIYNHWFNVVDLRRASWQPIIAIVLSILTGLATFSGTMSQIFHFP